ncbi:MAG: KilA-N domain-containing protein [Chitinophagales bacterium]
MVSKKKQIIVEDSIISVVNHNAEDYISLTDMVKNIESGNAVIENWLRNKNTIEFLAIWEQLNNPNFNFLEFEEIRKEAGLNRFHLSAKKWIDTTNAIGIIAKAGRYGGTYAHKDIAFEFGTWISPKFKLLLIKEFQRLKEIESNKYNLEWDVKRILSKINYHIHTDAVKKHIIPKLNFSKDNEWLIYAEEADLLNVAVFGCTAKHWREANPKLAHEGKNIRDFASINELTVLSNLESLNSEMIKSNIKKDIRFKNLCRIVKQQLEVLNNQDFLKSLKKNADSTYLNEEKK